MSFLRRFLTNKVARVALTLCFLTGAALQATPFNPLSSESAVAEGNVQAAVGPAVEGWVHDKSGQVPVEGASVVLNGSITVTTNAEGYFAFSPADLVQLGLDPSNDGQAVSLRVEADGFAEWSISNAIYFNGAALRLHPKLAAEGEPPSVLQAATRGRVSLEDQIKQGLSLSDLSAPALDNALTWDNSFAQIDSSAASAALTPPATIRVYRTATQQVEVVPFKEYVKYVLPSEWIPTWKMESLKAGAMAVKSYAWFWVARGGKQTALGADVKDNTEDQVYDPNISYSTTDAAVDATFDYAMTRYGDLFQAQYCAGSYDGDPVGECPWAGPYMTQWGSAYHADQGMTWAWILQFFYTDLVITPAPPGGGYAGPPAGPPVPPQPRKPAPTATPAVFSVGQGADNPHVFQEAYQRNGGEAALGRPAGAVRWWLTYVSEHNVVAQPFTGADGKGNTWIVFDVLKSTSRGVSKAFLLNGALATAYATHEPAGPEWLGAPTSDPYPADGGGVTRQGFVNGTLSSRGNGAQYAPWPESYPNWKAEYFVGHQVPSPQLAPALDLPGDPASVLDVTTPSFSWTAEQQMPRAFGAGKGDWSAQFTRRYQSDGGTYEFVLRADSGTRLWINNMLAINGWHWSSPQEERYSADLAPGTHEIRVQYYNLDSSAQLGFEMQKRDTANTAAPAPQPPTPAAPPAPPVAAAPPSAVGNAQLRLKVQWLGRGAPPNDSWVQPLTLHLSAADTAAVLASYAGATDRNGVAFYSGLPAGVYNVHVKGPHSLQSARARIALTPGATIDLDMKMQVEGDLDGDNCVTVDDFAYLQSRLGTHRGIDGFDATADLNNDGMVSIADVSLMRAGFDRCGDVSADAAFSTMSASAAPSLSQALAPWLRPETLARDLKLSIWTSMDEARAGEYLDVAVLAETGGQPIDGASFVFKYDPSVLAPVDAAGNPASIMEPGLGLPSVMGNWLDRNGGMAGFSAGMLQGEAPAGQVVLAKLRFQVVARPATGTTGLAFHTGASNLMQLTNGGLNLLAEARDASVAITP